MPKDNKQELKSEIKRKYPQTRDELNSSTLKVLMRLSDTTSASVPSHRQKDNAFKDEVLDGHISHVGQKGASHNQKVLLIMDNMFNNMREQVLALNDEDDKFL